MVLGLLLSVHTLHHLVFQIAQGQIRNQTEARNEYFVFLPNGKFRFLLDAADQTNQYQTFPMFLSPICQFFIISSFRHCQLTPNRCFGNTIYLNT